MDCPAFHRHPRIGTTPEVDAERKRFTAELKREAVRLMERGDKPVAQLALALPAVFRVGGCAGSSWAVKGSCKSGGGCEASGEIRGEIKKQKGGKRSLRESIIASSATWGAAQFSIDVSGSSVPTPGSGHATIILIDSCSGATQAARTFNWIKVGSAIVLQSPHAVNEWAMAQGRSSDSVRYFLHPFAVEESSGWNTRQVAATYDGATYATSTSSWNVGSVEGWHGVSRVLPESPQLTRHCRQESARDTRLA